MRRVALATIFVSMLAIAGGYASAFLPGGVPAAAAFVFGIAIAAMMVAVLVLGATRHDRRLGALRWVFAFCFAVLAVGFSLALRAPAVTPTVRLWLGLPQGAAIILYVVGLLPLLVLPLAYAITFDRTTLSDDELEALRARLADLRAQGERERGRAREGAST
jgi:hypothetical protein